MAFTVAFARANFDCRRLTDTRVAEACRRADRTGDLRWEVLVAVDEWLDRMEAGERP